MCMYTDMRTLYSKRLQYIDYKEKLLGYLQNKKISTFRSEITEKCCTLIYYVVYFLSAVVNTCFLIVLLLLKFIW